MEANKIDITLLAAGRGVRLGKLTSNIQKCLLPLSEIDTVIDNALRIFVNSKRVGNVCVIGGYAIDTMADHLTERWYREVSLGKIILLYNHMFASTNNIITFVQAAPFLINGGILIEADLVCHPKIFNSILTCSSEQPDRSWMVIDEAGKDRPDAMRISLHTNGTINEIGKKIDSEISVGEYLGIVYLSPKDARVALEICQEIITEGNTNLFYEEALARGAPTHNLDLYPLSTQSFPWTEIDTPDDYQKAIKMYKGIIGNSDDSIGQ
jgi:choline kinase